ncbi:Peroxisomal membrane signal receptor PTS1 [Batrachochytrium dendrobatidis]|nr:Peroxisomal membrane signal receptor PTS1 [Batrachochytrium dendrobatidis]
MLCDVLVQTSKFSFQPTKFIATCIHIQLSTMNPNRGDGASGLLGALVGGGAECDTGNSLSHLVKHNSERGGGLHSDRLTTMPSRMPVPALWSRDARHELARAGRMELPNGGTMDEFLGMPQGSNSTFEFHNLRHELEQSIKNVPHTDKPGDIWADEFANEAHMRHLQNPQSYFNGAEFEQAFACAQDPLLQQHFKNPNWNTDFAQFNESANNAMFHPEVSKAERDAFEQQWNEQFNAVRSSIRQEHCNLDDSVLDPASQLDWENEFHKHLKQEPISKDTDEQEWKSTFEDVWKSAEYSNSLYGTDIAGNGANINSTKDWNAEFESMLGRDRLLNEADRDGLGSLSEMIDPDPISGPLVPYVFEKHNKYMDHPDPRGIGMELVQTRGSLSDAALAFEAAVQRDSNDTLAWMNLGNVQAENEKELAAIAALQKAVQEDPTNASALISLAVSYTNEKQDLQAYVTLERWLATKYPEIAKNSSLAADQQPYVVYPTQEFHNKLLSMYLAAANEGPAGAVGTEKSMVDPEVQIGLGLLFYSMNDYTKSVDCFTAALSARPDDYRLWNRLGATLANSGRSEEAIDAYHKALELKPTFVRARYNLGVGCLNIGCYQEAAEHLLGALSLHGTNHQNQANISLTLWDSLRRTFILMNRTDMADRVDASPDVSMFRDEFDF